MSKTTLIRLFKAFIISSVAAYVFINGPEIYAHGQYWLASTQSVSVHTTDAFAAIKPIRLPLSDIEQQPLPNQATLTIDKINVSVPIIFGVSVEADEIYKRLIDGVVHYSTTPKPGQGGASIILCHSSLYAWQYSKYGAPCALLNKLQPGDEFVVRYSDGRTFTYAMESSIIFNPLESGNDARLADFEKSPKPILLMVTCYPTGSNAKRISVKAVLQ